MKYRLLRVPGFMTALKAAFLAFWRRFLSYRGFGADGVTAGHEQQLLCMYVCMYVCMYIYVYTINK